MNTEQRIPLQDYTSNMDNIRLARCRINELQNIINELNRSHNNMPKSVSPIKRMLTPPVSSGKVCENTQKPSPRFKEPVIDTQILAGILPEQLMINVDSYQQLKVLGLGSYAIVRHAQRGQQQAAIKTYEKSKLNDQQKRKNVCREVKILSKLRHPNIIKLLGACETATQLHVIMEYSTSTSLNSFIKLKPNRKLEELEARMVFRQVLDAVHYCHHKNVVHRDIKLENLLIDENNRIKLIDFGFSIAIDPTSKLNVFCGTPSYMAPEIVNKQHYGFPADVWALGILLYKITTGVFPFRGHDDKELYRRINSGKVEYQPNMTLSLRNLIAKLLRVGQSERPQLRDIQNDEWLIL